jgi:hypothetical protein
MIKRMGTVLEAIALDGKCVGAKSAFKFVFDSNGIRYEKIVADWACDPTEAMWDDLSRRSMGTVDQFIGQSVEMLLKDGKVEKFNIKLERKK